MLEQLMIHLQKNELGLLIQDMQVNSKQIMDLIIVKTDLFLYFPEENIGINLHDHNRPGLLIDMTVNKRTSSKSKLLCFKGCHQKSQKTNSQNERNICTSNIWWGTCRKLDNSLSCDDVIMMRSSGNKTCKWPINTWKCSTSSQKHNEVPINTRKEAIINKTDSNKCWQRCSQIETCMHCWRKYKSHFRKPVFKMLNVYHMPQQFQSQRFIAKQKWKHAHK